jgi:hypothetical protein
MRIALAPGESLFRDEEDDDENHKPQQERDPGSRLCLFPMIRNSTKTTQQQQTSSPSKSSSNHSSLLDSHKLPMAFAHAALDSPHDLIVVNPTAFGTHIPNHVTMETAQLVQAVANIDSEDWARRFTSHYVLWPRVETEFSTDTAPPPLAPLATAMANDVTRPGSIAQRTVLSYGSSGETDDNVLFGAVARATVAQALAMPDIVANNHHSHDNNNNDQDAIILDNYGLLGLVAHRLLSQQSSSSGGHTAQRPAITLSILEINNEHDLFDLLSAKPFDPKNKVQLRHSTTATTTAQQTGSMVLLGLADVIVTDVKQVGRCVRRALAAATHKKRSLECGHVLAVLKVWTHQTAGSLNDVLDQSPAHGGSNNKYTVVQFLQIAQTSPVTTLSNGTTGAIIRHNAFVRQSITALGSVLRGTLLKEAGNDNSMVSSFRDSMLTQVLQRSIDPLNMWMGALLFWPM